MICEVFRSFELKRLRFTHEFFPRVFKGSVLYILQQVWRHLETAHNPAGELEMRKNLSKDFKGGTRMALMRALK